MNKMANQNKTKKPISLLEQKRKDLVQLLTKGVFNRSDHFHYYFVKWRSETEDALLRIFGEDSRELKKFELAAQLAPVRGSSIILSEHRRKTMLRAAAELEAILSSIKEYGIPEKQEGAIPPKAFIAHVDKKRIDEGRAIELLKQALSEIPHLKKLHHDNQEVKLWHDRVYDIINAGLDVYDKVNFSCSGAPSVDVRPLSDSGRQKHYLEDLEGRETALKSIVQKYEILGETVPTSKVPSEAVYPSDTPYSAYKHIKAVITQATKRLVVIDPYVDGSVIELLENVQHNVDIQVLTRNMKGDFKLAGQKFKEQREKAQQGKLEVRKSGKLHDRFIVADDKFFHLGASIKDAGTKMCAMSELEGSDIKSKLTETTSGYWAEAEIVL
jgi:hypothetical protein